MGPPPRSWTSWVDPSPDGRETFWQMYKRLTPPPIYRWSARHRQFIIDTRRGPVGQPNRERAREAYLRRRAHQSKARR